jgi:RND family efflux transporter MFP subunit
MTPRRKVWARWSHLLAQLVLALTFSAAVILLLLWLAGKFEPKVPVVAADVPAATVPAGSQVVPVRLRRMPIVESAVGSIRAVHETSVGSKLLARVLEVNLKAGQAVSAGDVLVRLDDSDLRAKLEQAAAAVKSAEASRDQAASEEKRYAPLAKDRVISQQEYERTVSAMKSADAELQRSREVVKEVQAMLDWATVRAPMNGVVIDKQIDVGDTVTPGQILVTIFDPTRMQLVASVRESLALELQTGQDIEVVIQGLDKQCVGTISEIVPEAKTASRTFQVKVTGPCPPGIYSGMFGRILIPLAEEEILVIPRQAVRNVGQLELVEIVEGERVSRRAIRTGRMLDSDVEVLSGLREGERVVATAA